MSRCSVVLCLPAISSKRRQDSVPYGLLAVKLSGPTSLLLTLQSFSVCWSSSGMLISNSPALFDKVAPLLIKTAASLTTAQI